MLQAIPLFVAALLAAAALTGCDRPASQIAPAAVNYNFADEDACEDAGMSDEFCDEMFPELEDFVPSTYGKPYSSKPKPYQSYKPTQPPIAKPYVTSKPFVVNPVYKPKAGEQLPVVKPVIRTPAKVQDRLPTVKASVSKPSPVSRPSAPARSSSPARAR